MKKLLSNVLPLMVILVLVLTACAAPATPVAEEPAAEQPAAEQPAAEEPAAEEPAAEPTKLTFVGWGGPEEYQVFKKLVDTFNANNPDIVIEYTQIPDDYVTKLKTMISGGTPPDIAYVPDGDFSAFAPKGTLVSIEPFMMTSKVIDQDNIWPSALRRYRWDKANKVLGSGDLYALPKDIGPTNLYINVDLFKANNVPLPPFDRPLTWDELIEIGTQLTVDANGKHPNEDGFDPENVVSWGIGDIWMENAIYGNGGKIVSDDGKTFLVDSPETIAAVQFLSDITHKYRIHPTSQQTSSQSVGQMFETGKLGMTTNGRWGTTYYRQTLKFDWDVIPNPVGPSGKVNGLEADCKWSGWSGSVGVAIIRGSNGEKNAEKAFRFLEYIAGPEGQTEQAALGFQIPNQVDLAKSDVFLQPGQKPAHAEVIVETARCAWPGPWTYTPLYGAAFDNEWWQGVWPEVVNDGTMTAEESIKARIGTMQQLLDENWANLETE